MEFDFIIGNPPWKRGSTKEIQPYERYIKIRRLNERNDKVPLRISNKEIAQAFLIRTSDFATASTEIALIVTSKVLYNLNATLFRKYFLTNFFIENVFELSAVRREIFNKSNDPSIAPPVILFFLFAFGKHTENNYLNYKSLKPNKFFSLFNIFIIQRYDFKG